MSISQHEAVSVLRRTIFRPGWRVSAAPAPGDGDQVHVGIEIETADSSFVTRGGEYRVPLTERAVLLVSARDYESTEALLFRLLGVIRELTEHEDREFLRTWDPAGERWTAPFHAHVRDGEQAWDRMQALPQPAVTRVSLSDAGPWLAPGCDQEDDKGDCWESGHSRAVRAAGCGEADDAALSECTEQRVRAAPGKEQADAGSPRIFEFPLVHATAHPVAVAGCNECDGGCASWG